MEVDNFFPFAMFIVLIKLYFGLQFVANNEPIFEGSQLPAYLMSLRHDLYARCQNEQAA